jgi:hypothetical protein
MITDVCVVIRSARERTEELCKKLILQQGIIQSNVSVVNEVPFSAAMRRGFEIGIDSGCKWTYCIDADVLLRNGAIGSMLSAAERTDKRMCEVQGFVYDKLFGGPRPAGNHFYRSSLLKEMIRRIPKEGVNIRPEYHTLQAMKEDGFAWADISISVGLHDSEQYLRDVYRKCFVQAHKHAYLAEMFLETWRSCSSADLDMRVALAGFADGIKHADEVRIDTRQTYYAVALDQLGLKEKDPIELSAWTSERIEKIIDEWQVSELFLRYFPSSQPAKVIANPSRLVRLRQRIRKRGPLIGSAFLGGAILNKIGSNIMRACD